MSKTLNSTDAFHCYRQNSGVSNSDPLVARLGDDTSAHQAIRRQIGISLARLPDPSWKRPPGQLPEKQAAGSDNNLRSPADLWRCAVSRTRSFWADTTVPADYALTMHISCLACSKPPADSRLHCWAPRGTTAKHSLGTTAWTLSDIICIVMYAASLSWRHLLRPSASAPQRTGSNRRQKSGCSVPRSSSTDMLRSYDENTIRSQFDGK